jgi:hypothetical protein
MVARATLTVACLAVFGLSCASLTPCEDLEVTIGRSDEGLVVTPSEHPDGWGREDCGACHVLEVVHQRECTAGVDYQELEQRVGADGYDSCAVCHGANGVEP